MHDVWPSTGLQACYSIYALLGFLPPNGILPGAKFTLRQVLLNDYFTSVLTKDNGYVSRLLNKVEAKMPSVFFTPSAVSKCIKQPKRNGSVGPDNITAEFYKMRCNYILVPLSIIFNLSIQTGELPNIWKVASITPVFKKGS